MPLGPTLLHNALAESTELNTLQNVTGGGNLVTASSTVLLNCFQYIVSIVQGQIQNMMTTANAFVLDIPQRLLTFIQSIPSLVLAGLVSFGHGALNVLAQMMVQIASQIIGSGIIGVFLYKYRHRLKEVIAAVVNAAGSVVPEDWVDEEKIIDLIEEAAGVNTPSGSEDEGGERKTKEREDLSEDTPLLKNAESRSKTRDGNKGAAMRKRALKNGGGSKKPQSNQSCP
eukprot:GFKZ01002583.1.p1 GENE.GFKZ01002583.1~~GFKZ01002583.1.p1  ORF type:complete len:228 (+),score=28.82 GFKZ01002583.1:573-1256(+)